MPSTPSATSSTPVKSLTSGEDFSDDISTSLAPTTEDNYTEETSLYVTSTMENSFSEVTMPSTPSATTLTPVKSLTSGEDFSDDISTSLAPTTEDNYTEETSLYVTSTMENSFSEVTMPSTPSATTSTPVKSLTSGEDFSDDISTSLAPTTEDNTLKKHRCM
ncbi:cell wall integrity and stress response component 4-like [Colias croceus]|uniref:cell wall integrity and stress response component 4-like n=1 Tax=Colias crocea TaxID=72248 RepID=UPI001E27D5C5|nr:cell wall integrity and stress response component 4-like [Colias croceus]